MIFLKMMKIMNLILKKKLSQNDSEEEDNSFNEEDFSYKQDDLIYNPES